MILDRSASATSAAPFSAIFWSNFGLERFYDPSGLDLDDEDLI
jgi:hypothetical protein